MHTYKGLSATQADKLAKARQPGMFADGDGRYLSISRELFYA